MKIFEADNIELAYRDLILTLFVTPSTDEKTSEINNCCVIVHNPQIDNINFPFRKISEKYSRAELEWYWSGDNSCETIGKYAKMWLALSDDGKTNNSAYGYILFKKYGFDQVKQIIELLKKDPSSRRAVLNISDPTIDRINTKDMQCTIGLQFLIRNGGLEETVYMRSNDVYFGLPYDYIFFVSLGKYIAEQLGLELTLYTHHATSMHMYLRDREKFIPHNESFALDYRKIIEDCYEK